MRGRLLPNAGKRAIVLVTDGVNNMGADPLEVASGLGARGIRIFTVGIGTNGSGIAIPGTSEEASIDEDALRAIASFLAAAPTRASAMRDAADECLPQLGAYHGLGAPPRRRVSLPLALAGSRGDAA